MKLAFSTTYLDLDARTLGVPEIERSTSKAVSCQETPASGTQNTFKEDEVFYGLVKPPGEDQADENAHS